MKFGIDGLMNARTYEMLCGCINLFVKDKDADIDDFGEMKDLNPDNAPDYGCGDRGFAPAPATPEVLEKYGITEDEYNKICECLVDNLHVGYCGLCQ